MVGPSAGIRSGIQVGATNVVGSNPMVGVTQDATSMIYCPANASEWAKTMATAGISSGGPTSVWLFQDASGGPVDVLAANALTKTGTVNYQQAVTGWSRKAITYADGSGSTLSNTTTAPNSNVTSVLLLAYAFVSSTPAANRFTLLVGGSSANALEETTAGQYAVFANTTASGTASPFTGTVRPTVLANNVTASSCIGYTDRDKMVPSYRVTTGSVAMYLIDGPPAGGTLYAAMFSGAAAELTSAQIKKLLKTLGWNPTWT